MDLALNEGKLFVGGLRRRTSEDTLEQHFSKYGQVKETFILYDRQTTISRGFGFVSFEDPSVAQQALQDEHIVDGKKVDVKPAMPKNHCLHRQEENNVSSEKLSSDNGNMTDHRTKKIFVGGLPHNITKEEFRNFFTTFGTITDAVVMHDKLSGRPRGFGFITFDSEDSVDAVLQNCYHQLNGHIVEVKKAKPREICDDYTNRMNFVHINYPHYFGCYWDPYTGLPYFYSHRYGDWYHP